MNSDALLWASGHAVQAFDGAGSKNDNRGAKLVNVETHISN